MIEKTRGLLAEFKNFAIKGNAFELAIAVVIGTAFSAIVSSLVADIITPLLALVTGGVDFKDMAWVAREGVTVRYGTFLQAIFNFILVSLSIFLVFKTISAMRKRIFKEAQEVPPHEKPAQERLLEEIRDLLKEGK